MDNFSFNTNFLNDITTLTDESNSNTRNIAPSPMNIQNNSGNNNRRLSLGNLNTNVSVNPGASWSPTGQLQPNNYSSILTSTPSSILTNSLIDENRFNFEPNTLIQDTDVFNYPSSILLDQLQQHQQQQQQRQQQNLLIQQQLQKQRQIKQQSNDESFANFVKLCGATGIIDLQQSSSSGNSFQQQLMSPPQRSNKVTTAQSMRRSSYCSSSMVSSLKPVDEFPLSPRTSSPSLSQTQQYLLSEFRKKQNLQKSILKDVLAGNNNRSQQYATPPSKPRTRAISAGNAFNMQESLNSEGGSFNQSLINSKYPTSLSSSFSNSSLSNSSSKLYESFEEKLAITGNIFQKREDWSILGKLPINKQNSIHIRVNDEGPYGNDEIRCFVLGHLSSKGVTDITCVMCACNLVVYDRFPIVDGILFISPFNYNPTKSIPTPLSHKNQFMYGLCLSCLNSNQTHNTRCAFCDKEWHTMGCSSLQIGTLYKYDILAAFPCCESRLTCNNCSKLIVDVEGSKLKNFSSFSQEVQCPHCLVVDTHFLKPIQKMFTKAECEINLEWSLKNLPQE